LAFIVHASKKHVFGHKLFCGGGKRLVALLTVACVFALVASPAQRKKKKEEETQTLQLPKDLPNAVMGETRRLTFHVTPLSSRGLLSQQIRDGLKALSRDSGSETVLKIRAFVAGSGDLRRVRDLISETFTDRHQPLPALSLVQAGGLPMEGAQVVMEAVAAGKKDVNPEGLVFLSGHPAAAENPLGPVSPLVSKSLESLREELKAAGSDAPDVLRVTCFLSSLENLGETRKLVEAEYPRAALNYVQTQRAPGQALASCEAVARLRWRTGTALHFVEAAGIAKESGLSQVALVAAPQLVFTGTQVSFGYQEADARLAFDRLRKALEQVGVTTANVAYAHYYPLAPSIAAQLRKVRAEYFNSAQPPAGTMLLFEGLPSMDAGFAVDVVAVKEK
jgi:enamine deaminase RidA (YjgF/YER057c/UK114 family)